jgi:hypothetical protein
MSGTAAAAIGAAQRLADKYAPIVMMRAQQHALCDSSEEQFWPPTSVEVVLGNPTVRLLRRAAGTHVVKRAPPRQTSPIGTRAITSTCPARR